MSDIHKAAGIVAKDRKLLQSVRHIALATVNEDESPHNTPLFFIYNSDFSKMYFGSHKDSIHTNNFVRTGEGYVTVFDSKVLDKGGLYIRLVNGKRTSDSEIAKAMKAHNEARVRWGKRPLPKDHYPTESGQNMYVADIAKVEVYCSERDSDGNIVKETREEISVKELVDNE